MTIKTYDGVDLVKSQLSKYPANSLTAREVFFTVPCSSNDEELAYKTNNVITSALYDYAEKYIKSNPQENKPSFKMTALSDIKVKVDDSAQRNRELSNLVMNAISNITAK